MPFCPGCGHGPSVKNISKALEQSGFSPLDVILVSDIGCSGLVDPLFATHTVHGLHGRSPALGMGISMGLSDPRKKVVVIQGDGGATIGLQHLLEAARRNVNMTLIVLNNLIYGMTGGQVSGLSTSTFKADRNIEDHTPPFDICQLAHQAGASFVARVTSPKHFTERLTEAFGKPGFSLVEISSLCQPYGAGKMHDLECWVEDDVLFRNSREKFEIHTHKTASLFSESDIMYPEFNANAVNRTGVLIAGSAGGGVQSAARMLAGAGILSGLYTTMKNDYPITVGTGYSVAEVILSRDKIHYSGLESPDVIIIVTEDGMLKVKDRIGNDPTLILDSKLRDESHMHATYTDFIKTAGKKGAALCAISYWLEQSGTLKIDALLAAADRHRYAGKLKAIISNSVNLAQA